MPDEPAETERSYHTENNSDCCWLFFVKYIQKLYKTIGCIVSKCL